MRIETPKSNIKYKTETEKNLCNLQLSNQYFLQLSIYINVLPSVYTNVQRHNYTYVEFLRRDTKDKSKIHG